MNCDYADIVERIAEPPKWWDENGTPRYCDFHPDAVANIYAREACLLRITCQNCGREFDVAMSFDGHHPCGALVDRIRAKELAYGDPPSVGCCASGPTMNSEPRMVLQFWHRPHWDWVRDSALEVDVTPDWVER